MMTRGKQRLSKGTSATQGKATSVGAKRPSSTRSVPSVACKRSRRVPPNNGPVQTPHLADATHPAELERQPLTGNSTTAVDRQELTTSLNPSSVSIPDLTKAVSAAVIKSLSEAGVIPSANTVPTTEQNADPAAAVQESVAAVVQDLTAEGHNFQSNNDSVISGIPRPVCSSRTDNCSSTSATRKLADITKTLLEASISSASVKAYKRPWALFTSWAQQFLGDMLITLPIQPAILAFFIAHLYSSKYAASSVTTYVSAISYVHQLAAVDDPTEAAIINQLLKGYRKLAPTRDIRLPITLPILNKLLGSFQHTVSSADQIHLLSAMCAIAFFAFLRIGEITTTSG
ncbi:unnamed protein product, partial [Porites lobata]